MLRSGRRIPPGLFSPVVKGGGSASFVPEKPQFVKSRVPMQSKVAIAGKVLKIPSGSNIDFNVR